MRIGAVLLSLVIPGCGHLLLGRAARGLCWFAAQMLALGLVPWLGLPALLATFLVNPAAAVDAAIVKPGEQRSAAWMVGGGVGIGVGGITIPLFLLILVIRPFKIPAGSGIPTVQVGDHIFVSRLDRSAERGDLIVFRYPPEPRKDFIKRVIARGGDRIAVRGGAVFLNGQVLPRRILAEPYRYWDYDDGAGRWHQREARQFEEGPLDATYRTLVDHEGSGLHDYPPAQGDCGEKMRPAPDDPGACLVPEGHVFVMGDNRDNSYDSRYWGPVPLSHVKGKALSVWWSSGPRGVRWDRIGLRIR